MISPDDNKLPTLEIAGTDVPDIADAAATLQGFADDKSLLRHGFLLGEHRLLHDGSLSVELMNLQEATRLPNTPMWFAGLISVRGTLVPVFDLEKLFGVGANTGSRPMLLVVGEGERSAGLKISGLPTLMRIDPAAREEPDERVPEGLRPFARAVYRHEQQTWCEIDFDKMFVHFGAMLNITS